MTALDRPPGWNEYVAKTIADWAPPTAEQAEILRGLFGPELEAVRRAQSAEDQPGSCPAEARVPGCGGGNDDGTRQPEAVGCSHHPRRHPAGVGYALKGRPQPHHPRGGGGVTTVNVGRSWRSTAKHGLMRSIVGQEIGVVGLGRGDDRHVFYDLSAGDGMVDYEPAWDAMCSPGILARHAAAAAKASRRALVLLYEIQPNTYDRLLGSLANEWHLPQFGYVKDGEDCWRIGDKVELRAINASGQTADVSFLRRSDAVLVFSDPNAITEWPIRPSFAAEIRAEVWRCRILSTMGCNPAGLKRLPLAERLGWFPLVEAQQAALPGYRDLLLAAIQRDDAQWAYLLSTSQNWRGSTEAVFRTEFRRVGRETEVAWWRQDPDRFREVLLRLFLTRSEEDARELIRGHEEQWLELGTEERYRFLTERGANES